ncbi:BnaAnng24720D [Brassica napus]|uniref:BnaAnng24720D protein n=1 Tax=Brassica napus TaxID=3708 RepID=A0A078JMC9_BRANA|nr:BnaAnng24720D [Brassica napus]
MTDRVFPASKPPTATNGVPPAPPPAPTAVNGNGAANGTANQKPQVYIPANRPVYRPQPYSRRHHHQSRPSCRRVCCCCCFWSILIFLLLALMAAIAATAVYVIYRPRPPSFSVPSLRISRVNLTTASDTSVSHLSSFFNFTLLSENPNGHLTFSYDPFAVTVKSAKSGETVANGTVPAFFSDNKNKTSFRGVIATSTPARELDPEEARRLKSDLARARVGFEIEMRTKVKLRMGKVKSEGVEIRVTCQGFEGTVPKGKTPTVATSKRTKCKSDLSVKRRTSFNFATQKYRLGFIIYEYHHQSMAEKLEPAKVLYCGVCSVPAITASSVLISADVSHGSLKKLQISILTYSKAVKMCLVHVRTSKKEEVKRLPGGKLKKESKQEVIIEKVVRNKRKCITIVKGLELFGIKLSDASKKLGKKFATGASVVKVPGRSIFFIEDGKKVQAG